MATYGGVIVGEVGQSPEYQVQLRNSGRLVNNETKFGTAWEVHRCMDRSDGKWGNYEILFISPEVFENEDDAKRDAVQKLKALTCCDESPLRTALHTAIDLIVDEH